MRVISLLMNLIRFGLIRHYYHYQLVPAATPESSLLMRSAARCAGGLQLLKQAPPALHVANESIPVFAGSQVLVQTAEFLAHFCFTH
jgi:hypothetical protein